MTPLTDADRRLLQILQADSRIPNQELAERAYGRTPRSDADDW